MTDTVVEDPVVDPPAADAAADPPRTAPVARGRRTPASGSRWALRLLALGYVTILVLLPFGMMARRTFEHGLGAFLDSITAPEAVSAITLSLNVAFQATVINTVFGVLVAMLLTRYRFPGRRWLNALIDLPVSVSPVIAGLALILVYGNSGWFGGFLAEIGYQVIYSVPGIVMATCFVSLPLVVREIVPVLEEIGLEQDQAARSLGANAWQRFRKLTLPGIRWALAYGVVLNLARALGEFGAVRVVAGNVLESTQTMPLLAAQRYQDLDEDGAYAISFVMVAIAILCIVIVAVLRPRDHR